MNKFIHLHTHSHYSLLNALPKVPELIGAAKADGQTALALTDDGNMYAAIEHYRECKKVGIKPIIGVDFFVAPRTISDKEFRIDNATTRLVLLAKNVSGYHNLIKMVSDSFSLGFFYTPRIDKELLEKYKDGLLAILPASAGPHTQALKDNNSGKAEEIVKLYKELFGEDLYLELTHHPEIIGHGDLSHKIIKLAGATGTPLVAAQDVYYMQKEDNMVCELARHIHSGTSTLGDEADRLDDFSFIDQKTAKEYFKNQQEALANTIKVANKCNLELKLGEWTFPNYPLESGKDYDQMLRELTYKRLGEMDIEVTDKIKDRIEYELGVIITKGYSPYFLVVSDLMCAAKDMGIYTNTRGSAAGSFVSYLTGIIKMNPLDYNLPFERFLNPERPSPPDIDMDIADDRRDDLIDYTRQKYGASAVAQIGTFGTMAARAVVRDVSRALGHSYSIGDRIAKLIPFGAQGFPMTIDKALKIEPELKEAYDNDSETREIIDLAKKLEGNARHMGVHAAAVVIAPTKTTDFVPIQPDPKGGKMVTQYDMYSVEDAGLLKYDFLGLKNLAVLADAVKRVKKIQDIDIDLDEIPLDDGNTYKMIADGHTIGVFQLASSGMTKWLMELKPTTVHDINAMVALYRPGPMEFIPDFIARKRDPRKIKYVDPRLEKYLKPTFGILIYQDDIMLIAVELAGYSWLEADNFRKAMGKKIPEVMAEEKQKFQDGCIEHGMNYNATHALWEMIETFAAYGFNKSHSVSYGNLAYRTAYMKANYPLEFMSALLTADAGDIDKVSEIISECKNMGLEILPPDINESFAVFAVVPDKNAIRFGLKSIKNFGNAISDAIVSERKQNGEFTSLADFLTRVEDKNLNRRSLDALVKSGALDRFQAREDMLENIDHLLEYHKEMVNKPDGQSSLFGGLDTTLTKLTLTEASPISLAEKLAWEKELLGLYVSGHPLDSHKKKLADKPTITKVKKSTRPGVTTVIAGLIEDSKIILTKKGEKMAFVKLSDHTDSLEAVVFPNVYREYADKLTPEKCVMFKGRISKRNTETSFQVDAVKEL